MKAAAATIGILFTALTWTGANAAVISTNPITGTNPSTDNPYVTGKTDDPNITASGIGRGTGISASTANDRYSAKSWSSTFDPTDYFTFTLDAKDGYELNFDSFVYTGTASGTGPTVFALRSSLDGFATNIGSPTATGKTIDLSDASYQGITSPIEFRLYGYAASGSTGTFSINDYTFNGSVAAVPEPNTLALLGAGSLLMLANRHRTRKQAEAEGLL